MDVGAILAVLGMGGFTVAILAIGTRLLWLSSRTRQLPELLIGVAFLVPFVAFAAFALIALGGLVADSVRETLELLLGR